MSFFAYDKKLNLYYVFFIVYLVWIILAQNPDNIRHLIPLIFIANILISSYLSKYSYYFVLFIVFFNISIITNYSSNLSPIEQIITDISDKDKTIITNRGIEILRNYQNNPIIDKYYVHSSNFFKNQNKVYTINTEQSNKEINTMYKGRFIGEKKLFLY